VVAGTGVPHAAQGCDSIMDAWQGGNAYMCTCACTVPIHQSFAGSLRKILATN
jgi:hypothetical protein